MKESGFRCSAGRVASAEGIATLQSLCQEVGCPYHDERVPPPAVLHL